MAEKSQEGKSEKKDEWKPITPEEVKRLLEEGYQLGLDMQKQLRGMHRIPDKALKLRLR